jgi:hypothetical protein
MANPQTMDRAAAYQLSQPCVVKMARMSLAETMGCQRQGITNANETTIGKVQGNLSSFDRRWLGAGGSFDSINFPPLNQEMLSSLRPQNRRSS